MPIKKQNCIKSGNRWVARLELPPEGGKRHIKAFYGKTRAEAMAKREIYKSERTLYQREPTDDAQTLGQYLERWLNIVQQSGRISWRTWNGYRQRLQDHVIPVLGRVKLSKLTALQVQEMINALLTSGLAPRTVWHVRTVLRTALHDAVRWKQVYMNAAADTDPPKIPQMQTIVWEPAQARKFLKSLEGDRLYALYAVAVSLGLRMSEMTGLRWEDLDLVKGQIYIRYALKHRKRPGLTREFYLGLVKTAKSKRMLRLPESLQGVLMAHKAQQDADLRSLRNDWRDNDLVFPSAVGSPMEPENLLRHLHMLLEDAGLPRVSIHDLRHTAATLMLSANVPLKVVSDILGHRDISTTANIYQHVLPDMMREALTLMDGLLITPLTGAEDVV